MLATLVAAVVVTVASAAQLAAELRSRVPSVVELNGQSVLAAEKPPEIATYKLRLCNAYTSSDRLEMRRLQEPRIVEYPLPYKQCNDYMMPLREGDQLQFRAGDQEVGIFTVTGLPTDTQDTLLLIPHHRDASTTSVSFASHIFKRSMDSAQVAIVDAYQGSSQSTLLLEEPAQQEEISFDTVISLRPGEYDFVLKNSLGSTEPSNTYCPSHGYCRHPTTKVQIATHAQDHYLVMRVGMGAPAVRQGFPEELIVFPQTSRSGCIGRAGASALLLGMLLFWQLA